MAITIRDVYAQSARYPQSWLGRMILVRSIAVRSTRVTCPQRIACLAEQPVLVDSDPAADVAPLPIELGPLDPVLAQLRAMPLVGRLAPPVQEVVWGRPAIFRLRIQESVDPACTGCIEGLVLDAAPQDLGTTGALERPTTP